MTNLVLDCPVSRFLLKQISQAQSITKMKNVSGAQNIFSFFRPNESNEPDLVG